MRRRRFFTVLILRPTGAKFRRLHLSYGFAAATTMLVVVLVAAGLVAPRLLFQVSSQSLTLEQLVEENRDLRRDREQFDLALADVSGRLDAYEAQARRLARELGVSDLLTQEPAAGGAAEGAIAGRWIDAEMRGLESRAGTLDRSFDQLGAAFDDRIRQLAATPNTMPVEGWFSHGYGWRKDPFTGQREFHRGMDIVAHANTKIVAPADGVVSRSGRYSDYGLSIDIAHGHGFVTRYAHMNKALVKPGDRVRRGDVIGLVGSTGRSTGPHLHYEVFVDGRRVNPWKYLGHDR
jgi:murein DD-endopeptidase MepM/ murein hydrolase activator NlpD